MASVVITGGAGFIGSNIADRLMAKGDRVVIVDDLSSGKRANIPQGAEFHQLDICSPQAAQLLRDLRPDVLVHAAAQISVTASMREPVRDAAINVCGTLNLLQAVAGERAPFVVFLSTGGAIYGEQEVFPAPENHRTQPTSVYGTSKRAVELYLDLWAREYGLRYTALRLANVYGPRQDPHGEAGVVAIFSRALIEGRQPTIFGSGEQTRDFVFVEDVALAVELAAARNEVGTYNIGTGIETSVNQLYRCMQQVLGSDVEAAYAPARAGEQQRSVIDPTLAEQVLGWKPRFGLRDGLARTCEWFKQSAGG